MPSPASWPPPRFQDRSLDTFRAEMNVTRKAFAAARRFADGKIRSLVLAGPTGVGKTHLAVGAARARHDAERAAYQIRYDEWEAANPPREFMTWNDRSDRDLAAAAIGWPPLPEWCSVPELIVGLRSDMDRERDDRQWADRLADYAKFSGVVILDDLGREKVSDWTGEMIYTLVNRRYEYLLPTIVTTNLTGAELGASPYWPVISRLAEDGELVRIEGKDWRLAK